MQRLYAAYLGNIDGAVKSWTIAIRGLAPVIVEAGMRLAEFGSTLERMTAQQNAHGLPLDASKGRTGSPSQTGVQAARGPYTSAGYVDEIHHWQGGRR